MHSSSLLSEEEESGQQNHHKVEHRFLILTTNSLRRKWCRDAMAAQVEIYRTSVLAKGRFKRTTLEQRDMQEKYGRS